MPPSTRARGTATTPPSASASAGAQDRLGPLGDRETTPEIDKETGFFGIAPHRLLEGGERLRPLAQRRPRRAHGMDRRRRQGR
jgi:hypothetical protein